MQEEWKYIENTNEQYQISNLGNVRYLLDGVSVYIKPNKDRCGYLRVKINNRTYAVHRLVAIAFIPNPYNYPIVHHIDENKSNNVKSNLLWCTHQQNRIFGVPSASGKNAKRKYKILQFDMDGKLIAEWNTFTAAALSLGLKDGSEISKCAHHKKYRDSAYGYKWDIQYEEDLSKSSLLYLSEKAFDLAPKETIETLQKIIKKYNKI